MREEQSSIQGFNCEQCGCPMQYDRDRQYFVCKACGGKKYLIDSDKVRTTSMYYDNKKAERDAKTNQYRANIVTMVIIAVVGLILSALGSIIRYSFFHQYQSIFLLITIIGVIGLVVAIIKSMKSNKK